MGDFLCWTFSQKALEHISDIDPALLARQIRIKPPLRNDVREILLAGKSEQTAALGDPGL